MTRQSNFLILLMSLILSGVFISDLWAGQQPFSLWLDEFKSEAIQAGISEATIDKAFANVKPLENVLESDRNQPESKRTLDEYLSNTVNQLRVKKGQDQLRKNWKLFAAIDKNYPVQSRFLVALWAIETDFGRNQGLIPVFQSLVTLSYDTRRSQYFKKELLNALHILDQNKATLEQLKGSWAGAMGQVQFMPSVFLQNAVDFDNDGQVDIWKSQPDALASAAKYLGSLGWKRNWTWGREVRVPADFDLQLQGLDLQLRLTDWQKLGVRRLNGKSLPANAVRASLIRPDGPDGRSFLVYDNYRKIMSWNRSHNFSLAVGLLADQIGDMEN